MSELEDGPTDFGPGDVVRVVAGPFAGCLGTVTRVDRLRRRFRVAVDLYGRESRLDLDFRQVEAVS